MEIKVADKAGFCFGVDRAVKIAYEAANSGRKPIFTYGMLIHNRDVTNELEQMGVRCIESIDEIPSGASVIIRAHGITEGECEKLLQKNVEIIDATCPFVKRIHNIVKEEYENGRQIVIAGDRNHPEVKGINGWCNNSAEIFYSDDECEYFLEKNGFIP